MRPARESDLRILFKLVPNSTEGGCHARIWLPKVYRRGTSETIDVAIMLHGGGWTWGDDSDVPEAEVNYLLEKGMVVVSLQYRLAPHVRYKEIVTDIVDGYRWILEDLPKHVPGAKKVGGTIAMGWSAGGHLSGLLGHHSRKAGLAAPNAIMSTYGLNHIAPGQAICLPANRWGQGLSEEDKVYAMKVFDEPVSTGIPFGSESQEQPRDTWGREMIGQSALCSYLCDVETIDTSPTCTPYSPLHLVTKSYPPTFVLVATLDNLVPVEQSYGFYNALKEAGVECELREAVGMKHGESENLKWDVGHTEADYEKWFEEAIRPGLDFLLRHTPSEVGV